jgi:hypothetical protein
MWKFSASLNCISGSFISDMTPCAPDGGFGLSYPTGDASLSGNEAKRRPGKVRAAIERTLDKSIQKAGEKPPATPLVPRRVFDARRSIPSGPHPGIFTKPVGQAPCEKPAVAKKIESLTP